MLKEMGVGIEVSKAQARVSGSLFLLPVDLDIELSATPPVSCLPACHYIPHHDDYGFKLYPPNCPYNPHTNHTKDNIHSKNTPV